MTGWTKAQVQTFTAEVRREAGPAWTWFGPRVQQALLAERAFEVVRGQHVAVSAAEMAALLHAMLVEAGLRDE